MAHTVLICDDAIFMRTMVGDILQQAGYEVVAVSGGKEALKFLEGCTALPDLILLDCM